MTKLNIISKDILTVEKGIVIQCSNTIGVVGGLAKAIATKYPQVYKRYKQDLALGANLGEGSVCQITEDLFFISMLTQSEIGTYYKVQTNFEALESCLKKVKLCSDIYNLPVWIPYYLGSGLGGGSTQQTKQETWAKVSELIMSILPEATICKLG